MTDKTLKICKRPAGIHLNYYQIHSCPRVNLGKSLGKPVGLTRSQSESGLRAVAAVQVSRKNRIGRGGGVHSAQAPRLWEGKYRSKTKHGVN
jgi:hypothetical protein